MARPVALITGAGSGIGRATAVLLAETGYSLALVGRRREALAESVAGLDSPAEHLAIAADVGDPAQAAGAIDACVRKWGGLGALINNAGVAPMAPIDRHTPDLIDQVYRTNALGPAYLIARAWPAFQQQHATAGRTACIVNIATQGIDDPYPGFFGYAAAKAAAATMVKSCAKEGADIGLRAFAIAPGAVETGMFRALFSEAQVPRATTIPPESVARVILECLRGDHDAQNGETIRLKGR